MLGAMTSHPDERLRSLPADAVVFCDIDNTLVFGASVYQFGWEALRQGMIGWRDVVPALFDQRHFVRSGENETRMANTRERALALVKGQTPAAFSEVAQATWETRMRKRLFPEMVEILAQHRALGHEVYLASASPQDLVEVMAAGLGLTGGLGTELEISDGVFTGDLIGTLLHGETKSKAAFQLADTLNVPKERLVAYSDSIADLPLLEGVGHPVTVNPDRRLHHVAVERDWPVVWPAATARYQRHRV
jgi:HAD superfamily hydrolase (TIGR01490 family)